MSAHPLTSAVVASAFRVGELDENAHELPASTNKMNRYSGWRYSAEWILSSTAYGPIRASRCWLNRRSALSSVHCSKRCTRARRRGAHNRAGRPLLLPISLSPLSVICSR
jgi:hypothetical protein